MDNNNNEIKELWLKGLTGSQIASELCITRNSVMGKLHRMRHSGLLSGAALDERIKIINSSVKRDNEDNRKSKQKINIENVIGDLFPETEDHDDHLDTIICEEIIDSPIIGGITFDMLAPKSCRFIINNGDPKEFRFCGQPKKGRSYCDTHEKICYYRPTHKEELCDEE